MENRATEEKRIITDGQDLAETAQKLREDGVTDYHNCIMVEEMYFDKETLASLEIGTILEIEFDGYFLETYPGQLSNLYSVKATGKVDESEIPALREQEQYIRENYTGEQ